MSMVGTKKELGQHWLKNREILDHIADEAVGNGSGENGDEGITCVEIGPGLGTLTSSLLKRFDRVLAVEYDERLAKNLPKSFPGKNLMVVCDDILKFDWWVHVEKPYVVVGNIPYYITQPIIKRVLDGCPKKPERVVLLMQKEVAERVTARHGRTPLSLLAENWAEVEAGMIVRAEEFEPAPKIDSQVVIFKMREKSLWEGDVRELGAVASIAFKAPRKKVLNNFQRVMSKERALDLLEGAGVNPDLRPGDLTIGDYQIIWDMMTTDERIASLNRFMAQ